MTPPKIYHDTSITKTIYNTKNNRGTGNRGYWGQEAGGTGDRKQGILGTGSRGYWGQEAGDTGDRKQGVLGTGSRGGGGGGGDWCTPYFISR